MTVAYLLKHDKFGSNFVLTKQNLPNSIILPPKNGGFKARSHSVRKANSRAFSVRVRPQGPGDEDGRWMEGIELRNITHLNRLHPVAQLVEHWISKPKIAGSIPTAVKPLFSLPGVDVDTLRVTAKKFTNVFNF